MKIKDLKNMIKNLPDDMPVVECRAGNIGSWTETPNLSVRTVYKFKAIRHYGQNQGKPYCVEFCKIYENNFHSLESEYRALVFYTEE